MKEFFLKAFIALSVLLVASCGSMPKHNEIRGDDQPTVAFDEDGYGSQVYINGNYAGVISEDNQIFRVSPGNHDLRIVTPSGQVIERAIFIQGSTRREISVSN